MDAIQKKMLGSKMLRRIAEMTDERKARGIFPPHPLVRHLFACFPDVLTADLWETLDELKSQGYVMVGRSLNDYWVEAVRDG